MLSFSPHLLFLLIPPLQIIAFARMRLLPKARLTLRMYFQSLCSFSLPPSPPSLFPHSLPPHLLILLYQISVAYDVQGATVVSNFSLKIQPTEKIGIIGRTGAGKVPYFFLYHPSGGFFFDDLLALDLPRSGPIPSDPHRQGIDRDRWRRYHFHRYFLIPSSSLIFDAHLCSQISLCFAISSPSFLRIRFSSMPLFARTWIPSSATRTTRSGLPSIRFDHHYPSLDAFLFSGIFSYAYTIIL